MFVCVILQVPFPAPRCNVDLWHGHLFPVLVPLGGHHRLRVDGLLLAEGIHGELPFLMALSSLFLRVHAWLINKYKQVALSKIVL